MSSLRLYWQAFEPATWEPSLHCASQKDSQSRKDRGGSMSICRWIGRVENESRVRYE